ncbi:MULTISPECIES: hypothetical protein [unclassified Mesobacillus]|uniref:hypothetical protein n=1 Tax=unclassified Mesobacillus TaxID=2675270 RepID=UPI002040DAEF|nr:MULTISPECIES: hypothetical protein [unclassified Mesobacillus]MCM3121777.1 hypothetical protein [Mesobacillus sp. MER 33]MCM3231741.1 hypothetical protein [Mesobacillus sp. MER 48]
MKCIGEFLEHEKYNAYGRIAIIENKEAILKVFGFKNGKWLDLWDIDPRVLTLFYRSYEDECDWFIVVYDYPSFCIDNDIKEAIIWHEIGHIEHPVPEQQVSIDSEIHCDNLAIKNGHKEGIRKILNLTMMMAKTLNHEILTQMTMERQMKLPF